MSALVIVTALSLIGLSNGCLTVTPRIVRDKTPSSDSGEWNSGFRGWYVTNGQTFAVMSPFAHDRYNALIGLYGKEYLKPLTTNDGTTPFTNGTFLIDDTHNVKFGEMNVWHHNRASHFGN